MIHSDSVTALKWKIGRSARIMVNGLWLMPAGM